MKKQFSIVVVALVLTLSGCAVGPKYKRPATSVPQQWTVNEPRGTSTREPAEQWWTVFHDAEFEKLVGRATQANLDLKLASARVAEARALRGISKSGLFPSIGASAAASRNRERVFAGATGASHSPAIMPIEVSNFQGGFDASWELDVFGRTRRGLQAATADIAAANELRRDVLVTVLGEVGRSYAELRGFQLRLDIAERNIAIQQDTLDLTKSRSAAGLATQLDVTRADAQLEATRSAVPVLQSGIEISIHRLSVLLGEEPGALRAELLPAAPVPLSPPEVPVGLPSQLLERRPDVRQAEAQIVAATARVGEAKANFFPRIQLLGDAGRQATQLHDLTLGVGNFFSAGPSISLPIFTGGRIRSEVRVADARLQQAVIGYRAAVLSALEDTENALVRYSQEQTRRERLENAVKSNEEAVRLSSELYRAGLTDFLAVLDAQRDLYANEDLLAQSRTAQTVNLIALYKALGGGWQGANLQ
jgi:NodT family efflux transporter outer membrane factor (OMF) lipoprotein